MSDCRFGVSPVTILILILTATTYLFSCSSQFDVPAGPGKYKPASVQKITIFRRKAAADTDEKILAFCCLRQFLKLFANKPHSKI